MPTTYWFNSFADPQTRHVMFYDDLVRDTQHELEKVLDFLNVDITKSQMRCAIRNKEGLYHRSKKKVVGVDLFDAKMQQSINDIKDRVYKLLQESKNDVAIFSRTMNASNL